MICTCGRLLSTAFLFLLVVRRGAILHPKLMGAAIGGVARLTGLSVLAMNCSKGTVRNPKLVAAGGPKEPWKEDTIQPGTTFRRHSVIKLSASAIVA
jgi:hypothetical protein